MTVWLPTLEQVLRLHGKLVARTGGLEGVRDTGLIESALMRAYASYGGYERYSSVVEKAAAVCCGLIENHGFFDGNKRIGIAVMLLILSQNGVRISYRQDEIVTRGLSIAQGAMDVPHTIEWINARCVDD